MFERKRTFQIFLVCFLTHCLAGDLSVLPHRPKNGQKIGKGYGAKASKGAVDCRHYRAAVDFHFDESIYGSVVTKSSIQLRYVTHDFEIPRDGFLLFSPNKKDQPKKQIKITSGMSGCVAQSCKRVCTGSIELAAIEEGTHVISVEMINLNGEQILHQPLRHTLFDKVPENWPNTEALQPLKTAFRLVSPFAEGHRCMIKDKVKLAFVGTADYDGQKAIWRAQMELLDRDSEFDIDYVTFVSSRGGREPFRQIVEGLEIRFVREDTGILTIDAMAYESSMEQLYALHTKSQPSCKMSLKHSHPVCYKWFYEMFYFYVNKGLLDFVLAMYGTLAGYDIVVFANSRSIADKLIVRMALLAGARAVVMELPNLYPVSDSRATAAVAPSYYVLKHPSIQQSGVDQLFLIHPGVNTTQFHPGLVQPKRSKASKVTIGFVGRVTTEKSLGLFVRMAQHLVYASTLCQTLVCEFVVVGAGEILEALKLFAKKLNIQIHFLGARYSGLPLLMASFDVIVNPSLRSSETFCIVNIEAMSAGIPVVSFGAGGVLDYLKHGVNGVHVTETSGPALAEGVLWVLNNQAKSRILKHNARESILAQFQIEQMVAKYGKLYRHLYCGTS